MLALTGVLMSREALQAFWLRGLLTVAVLFLLVTVLKTTGAIGWIGGLVYLAAILLTELLTNNALLF